MAFNDPRFPNQWQLGPGGVNLTPLYDEYRGRGVRVGIVDTGLDYTGAELQGQVDLSAGWNAITRGADPLNIGGDQHGTAVAEVLAARANNGVGGVGAAPEATLVAFKMDTRAARTPAQELELLSRQWQVDISHNSWSYSGEPFRDNFLGAYAAQGAAVADAAARGRGGLGTVVVRSAGNDGAWGDTVNAHSYQNNRYTMTVGATDQAGNVRDLSNPGASLWVVAPAEWTSFAAPLLSGTAALMLEANPGLGYRGVQTLVALSAKHADPGGAWTTNAAAGLVNGGGLRTSLKAGFGMVDARAAVRLAESWTAPPKTEANLLQSTAAGAAFAVPDLGAAAGKVAIADDFLVERALLTIDLAHPRVGDLIISLVSPGGTESVLLDRVGKGSYAGNGGLNFTLTSNQFFWEAAKGDWTLKVQDAAAGGAAQVKGWSLTVTGAPVTNEQVYVYTDRYAALAAAEPGRAVLADTDGGVDTLNAAAATGDSVIDLRPGATSIIANTPLKLAAGTRIEVAWGGDGNDRITADDAGGVLHGGRGRDTLAGGKGGDLLDGGAGADSLSGGGGADTLLGGDGDDVLSGGAGDDTLRGGQGADQMRGNEGANTYLYARGDGDDVVNWETDAAEADVLRFVDLAPGDLAFWRSGINLVAADRATGQAVRWDWHFHPDLKNVGVERIEFADGTAWGRAEIDAAARRTDQGTDGADTIYGSDFAETLRGGLGADNLRGGAGSDTYLYARGDGNDVINWESGAVSDVDTLRFVDLAPGDLTFSRRGIDLVVADNATGQTVRWDWHFHAELAGVGVERVEFAGGTVWGRAEIAAAAAIRGGAGADSLSGTAGNDVLVGGAGADSLSGTAGNDVLVGGGGADTLAGGTGADTFRYLALSDSAPAARDTVQDFSAAQGDRIDLSAIDADPLAAGDQAFAWVEAAAFAGGGAAQARSYQSGGYTFVEVDTGDGAADMVIRLAGAVDLAPGSFVL